MANQKNGKVVKMKKSKKAKRETKTIYRVTFGNDPSITTKQVGIGVKPDGEREFDSFISAKKAIIKDITMTVKHWQKVRHGIWAMKRSSAKAHESAAAA